MAYHVDYSTLSLKALLASKVSIQPSENGNLKGENSKNLWNGKSGTSSQK